MATKTNGLSRLERTALTLLVQTEQKSAATDGWALMSMAPRKVRDSLHAQGLVEEKKIGGLTLYRSTADGRDAVAPKRIEAEL